MSFNFSEKVAVEFQEGGDFHEGSLEFTFNNLAIWIRTGRKDAHHAWFEDRIG